MALKNPEVIEIVVKKWIEAEVGVKLQQNCIQTQRDFVSFGRFLTGEG